MINTAITFIIIIAFLLIYSLLNKFYFKKKKYGVANDSMRFLAFFFDMMIFNIITLGGGFLYFLFRGEIKSQVLVYIDDIVNKSGYGKLRHDWLEFEIKLFAIYMLYSMLMEGVSKKGSFGKQFLKIGYDRKHSILCVIVRNLLKPISFLVWPIGIIVSKSSPNRRWPHDLVCKENLVLKK